MEILAKAIKNITFFVQMIQFNSNDTATCPIEALFAAEKKKFLDNI